jgi:very-short-patch-repair endonuclease
MMKQSTPVIRDRSRRLRRNQTDAERKLWARLRARQLCGVKFRRQYPIGRFIVDFCCFEKDLAVELDGGQHAEQTEADQRRSDLLARHGYRVLRFWDNDVMENIDGVLQRIVETLRDSNVNFDPHPFPLPQGEGQREAPKNPTIQNRKSKI